MSFFAETAQFQAAVQLISKISVQDFKKVLELLVAGEQVPPKVQTVQSWVQHVVERAAFEQLQPKRLAEELKAQIPETHLEALLRYYQHYQKEVLSKLEHSSTVPTHLLDNSWRLHLNLAHDNLSTILEPYVFFQFKLGNPLDPNVIEENFTVEFSHEDLYNFFLSLEDIQSQMDNLG
eukprot:TRINITY_DN43_c0_g1_i1.p1 TRINITY_DN43_c0_g1~~TRINITY_DN43_c0_g1_i1.p1  ORF type:complete len:178 (+),score=38.80 TRINITY_DN43_c0_g1_i1:111-644(+)